MSNSYTIQENQRKILSNEKEAKFQRNSIIHIQEDLGGCNSHYQITLTTWSMFPSNYSVVFYSCSKTRKKGEKLINFSFFPHIFLDGQLTLVFRRHTITDL